MAERMLWESKREFVSSIASGFWIKARHYEHRAHDVGCMFSNCLHNFQITQVIKYILCLPFLSKTIILTCFFCPIYLEDVSVNLFRDRWRRLFCNSLKTTVSNLLNPVRCWMYKTLTFLDFVDMKDQNFHWLVLLVTFLHLPPLLR